MPYKTVLKNVIEPVKTGDVAMLRNISGGVE